MTDYEEQFFSDTEENIYVQNPELQDSYRAMERASGFPDEGWQLIGTRVDDVLRFEQTVEEEFITTVENILFHENLDFFDVDKQIIMGRTERLNTLQYKNPLLYVLGYYVYNKGFEPESIDKMRVRVEKEGYTIYDVVRYARFWATYLGL